MSIIMDFIKRNNDDLEDIIVKYPNTIPIPVAADFYFLSETQTWSHCSTSRHSDQSCHRRRNIRYQFVVSDIFYADQEINFMQITQNRDSARINVVDSLFFIYCQTLGCPCGKYEIYDNKLRTGNIRKIIKYKIMRESDD